ILCLAPLATVSSVLNVNMASLPRSALELRDIAAGAQTERRGGAGPAGACLAVRTPPADSSSRDPSLLRGASDLTSFPLPSVRPTQAASPASACELLRDTDVRTGRIGRAKGRVSSDSCSRRLKFT